MALTNVLEGQNPLLVKDPAGGAGGLAISPKPSEAGT